MSAQTGVLINASPLRKKPSILCLHGGGTNSIIFNVQTIRVQRLLAKFFDFVFLDGPFQSPPGPGVLPMFEGCEPFYRWSRTYEDGLSNETKLSVEGAVKGREEEIVGVLGFSQGAKLAAGLLLEQQLRQNAGFKFGVFLMGTSPPLLSPTLSNDEKLEVISVPSIHFVGLEDPWREQSRKLFADHFDTNFSSLVEFDIGHRLPTAEQDTLKIAEEIKRLYEETTGKALLDLDAISG